MYAVGAVLSPVAGPLVDRFGGRRSLMVAFASGGLGVAVAASAGRHYSGLLAGAGVFGISIAFGNPATNQLAARVVQAGRHGIVTGIKQSGVQVGAFLAGFVLPRVADATGWRAALGSCALLGAAGLVLAGRFVPHPSEGEGTADRAADADRVPARAAPLRFDRAVNRLAVYALLMGFGVGAVSAYLPLYAVEELDFSRGTAGLTAALMGFIGILARVGWGRRQDRTTKPVLRSLGTLAVGSVMATLAMGAAASLASGLLWVGAALFGATAVAWNSLGMLSIVRDVEVSVAGRASGRVLLGFYVGFLVGPVSFGWAVDHQGYAAAWAAVTAAFALASALTVAWIWDG
jgi:predicted MFS family arabinose efflux permease